MASLVSRINFRILNEFTNVFNFKIRSTLMSNNNHIYSFRGLKTESVEPTHIDEDNIVNETEIDEAMLEREADIQKNRNKSRLLPQHKNMVNGELPYAESKAWFHETLKYKRKMYGRFGEKSGVNPGLMWPTNDEIAETLDYEKVAFPYTLQEMIEKSKLEKEEEERVRKEREEEITKKLVKLDQWKAELNAKIAKKLVDAKASKDKKDRLVEEVRRHFGFKVDLRDDRFKEMLAQKEKEEKKVEKEARRKEREAKMLSKLAEMSSKAGVKESEPIQTTTSQDPQPNTGKTK